VFSPYLPASVFETIFRKSRGYQSSGGIARHVWHHIKNIIDQLKAAGVADQDALKEVTILFKIE
jgi:hypothetical protein